MRDLQVPRRESGVDPELAVRVGGAGQESVEADRDTCHGLATRATASEEELAPAGLEADGEPVLAAGGHRRAASDPRAMAGAPHGERSGAIPQEKRVPGLVRLLPGALAAHEDPPVGESRAARGVEDFEAQRRRRRGEPERQVLDGRLELAEREVPLAEAMGVDDDLVVPRVDFVPLEGALEAALGERLPVIAVPGRVAR